MDEVEKLKAEIETLKNTVSAMDRSAQMLVRRDLELRRANEQMRSLDREKSEFVSIAAHQIRTPLSAIKWSQQMLGDEELGTLNEDQKKMVEQTQASVSRMVRLVNNLLDADHLELGKGQYEIKEINVALILNEVIANLFSQASEKNIIIDFTHEGFFPKLKANADRIKDVFFNLIDNAIKYTPKNGRITIRMKNENGLVITIADSGIGIPVIHQNRMFTRFSRADNAKRVDADGSGLGLYIVKKIIEGNGGTINFSSVEGEGTVFTIHLPRVVDDSASAS